MNFSRFVALGLVVSTVALVACSSDDDDTGSSANAANPSPCAEAKQVADECNAKPASGGGKVTVKFDQDKCEADDRGKAAAECIVQNKSNCDCLLKCSLTGTCS